MNADFLPKWLDHHIWPQVQTMMLNDAYFKLMGRVRELTGEFNGPIAGLIEVGYITSQTMAIRRLCDGGRDVISLRRSLVEAKAKNLAPAAQIDQLSDRLDSCDHVCGLVNNYISPTPRIRFVGKRHQMELAVRAIGCGTEGDLRDRHFT
jgi:hypothetical protein